MPYPEKLLTVTKQLAPGLVTSSGPFLIFNAINVGYRMALVQRGDSVLVWSPIPYGTGVEEALKVLTGKLTNPTHLVVPNMHHTIAVKSFKEQFPDLKIFASHDVKLDGVTIDYVFGPQHANKRIGREELVKMGVNNESILNSFEFVYLDEHKNKEVIVFDKASKSIFAGDVVFNLGVPGTTTGKAVLEQYSPEAGATNGFNPHGGWSFFTRYLQPESIIGKRLMRRFVDPKGGFAGLKAVYGWDFERIVMCHGNVIEKDGKGVLKTLFPEINE